MGYLRLAPLISQRSTEQSQYGSSVIAGLGVADRMDPPRSDTHLSQ